MSRRQLPPRSTRGKRASQDAEVLARDDEIYQQVFGNGNEDSDEEFTRRDTDNLRKMIFCKNMAKFSYGRGYHYFYDLQQFPRLEGSPSYAVDLNNVFSSTYSRDVELLGGTPIGELINRKYFGLPRTDLEPRGVNRQAKTKNICHGYLFQNEDKKYHLDKLLLTCRAVLSRLEDLDRSSKISDFSLIRRDPELVVLTDRSISLELKRDIIVKKIRILEQRKEESKQAWENQDTTYFGQSLNQLLHNSILSLRANLKLENMAMRLVKFDSNHMEFLKEQHGYDDYHIRAIFAKTTNYHRTQNSFLSGAAVEKLLDYPERVVEVVNEQAVLRFPLVALDFGNRSFMQLADEILAIKLNIHSEFTYFAGKAVWRKLFGRELNLQKEEKSIQYEQYTKMAKKKIDELKRYYKNQSNPRTCPFTYPKLDRTVNYSEIEGSKASWVSLLRLSESKEITVKEYICLMVYQQMCISLADIYDYCLSSDSIAKVISSEFFVKFSHLLLEAVGTPNIGVLQASLEAFCEFMARPAPFDKTSFRIVYEHDKETNTGTLWLLPKEENWETEKEDQDQDDEDEEEEDVSSEPRKRIKLDRSP